VVETFSQVQGPVWIRGIYAKIGFSPKHILERNDDLWRNDAGSISALSARCDVTENTANPNDPDFCENIFWRKYYFRINTANPDRPQVACLLDSLFTRARHLYGRGHLVSLLSLRA
jgi:hypothetical protein